MFMCLFFPWVEVMLLWESQSVGGGGFRTWIHTPPWGVVQLQLASNMRARTPKPNPQSQSFFPKLRIYFADFPYLLCSRDQRQLTLETWCGYGYGQGRIIARSAFQGQWGAHQTPLRARCYTHQPTLFRNSWLAAFLLGRKSVMAWGFSY